MKRLIPAAIILFSVFAVCIVSHIYVKKACAETIENIENYYNKKISADVLESNWKKQKEKMELFVNHGFLDDISMNIGQLTIDNAENKDEFFIAYKNILTDLQLIKEDQKLAMHSFY